MTRTQGAGRTQEGLSVRLSISTYEQKKIAIACINNIVPNNVGNSTKHSL